MACSYGSTCVQSSDGLSAKCMCPLGCEGKPKQVVCGSDGKDYVNECELHQHACKNKKNIRVQYQGHCGKLSLCFLCLFLFFVTLILSTGNIEEFPSQFIFFPNPTPPYFFFFCCSKEMSQSHTIKYKLLQNMEIQKKNPDSIKNYISDGENVICVEIFCFKLSENLFFPFHCFLPLPFVFLYHIPCLFKAHLYSNSLILIFHSGCFSPHRFSYGADCCFL